MIVEKLLGIISKNDDKLIFKSKEFLFVLLINV